LTVRDARKISFGGASVADDRRAGEEADEREQEGREYWAIGASFGDEPQHGRKESFSKEV